MLLILIFISILPLQSFEADQFVKKAQEQARVFKDEAEALHYKTFKKGKTCGSRCYSQFDPLPGKKDENSQEEILVFVSLSMPGESLKSLYKAAKLISKPVRLILRGLKGGSFKETLQALQGLEITAEIDPTLFEEHAVSVVPTFVEAKTGNRLQGNITLVSALGKLEDAT